MAEETKPEHHLINGDWYLVNHENLEQILVAIGKSLLCNYAPQTKAAFIDQPVTSV